jgi:hypothetical protein
MALKYDLKKDKGDDGENRNELNEADRKIALEEKKYFNLDLVKPFVGPPDEIDHVKRQVD